MELVANFELSEGQEFDALFEINASGTTWGSIDGDIENQIDLYNILMSKADKTEVEEDITTLDNKIDNVQSDLSEDISTLNANLTAEISNRENADTALQTQITNLSGTVSSNYSTLNNSISNLSNTVDSNYNILDTKINTTQTTLQGNINTLSGTVTSNYNDLTQSITNNVSTLNTRITNEVSTLNGTISDEATTRANADNNLQTQIDAIVSSSDVFDIVGTYAELEAYDISTVPVKDIIKVLVDSTHNNAATYYRCVENAGVKSWSYIGSEGAYYTKGETDSTFVPQTRTINNKALNQNINLTASDVGALPVGTQIGNGTILLTQGGVQKGTFTLNQTSNATIDFDAVSEDITVDSELSISSENPVQNKIITTALNAKQDLLTSSNAGTDISITNRTGDTVTVSGEGSIALSEAASGKLNSVTLGGKCEQRSVLPDEFQRVEYLETDGNQYIDTGVLLNNTDEFEITFQSSKDVLTTPVMGAISGGASYTSTDNISVTYNVGSNVNAYSVYNNGGAGSPNYAWNGGDYTDKLKHTIKYTGLNTAPTIDGEAMTQITSHTISESNASVTTWLFGRNNTGAGTKAQDGLRIYDANFYSKGHFITCRRKSDSVLGVYNLITGAFKTNAGTGDFTAGPDVTTPSPDNVMPIWCNNGEIKYGFGQNLIDNTIDGQGTYATQSASTANRVFKAFGNISTGKYKVTISDGYEFVVQYRNTGGGSGNIGTWNTSGEYDLDNLDYSYGIAIRYPDNSAITPEDFNGTLSLQIQGIYTDGTKETVEVTGVNLANLTADNIVIGKIIDNSGSILSAVNNFYYAPFISIKPNTSYVMYGRTITDNKISAFNRICWYDKNQHFISRASYELNHIGQAISPSNAYYARFTVASYNSQNAITQAQILNFNWTFAEGTVEIPYEPYFNGGNATAEMLLSVGDYKDEQSVLDGNVTRNVGVKVLDGSESWNYYSVPQGIMFRTQIADSVSSTKDGLGVLCNCYTVTSNGQRTNNTISGSSKNYDFINDNYTTLDDWKAYLAQQYNAGTPVIIIYPLETPTTEAVEAQVLSIKDGDNTIAATGSLNALPLEASYNKQGGTLISFTNDSGYINGIDSNDVTTALGYTPYNSTNPDGYTSNVGTVTSVNNTQPDSNGNVTLNIPSPIVDQTYNASSTNAQSGTAVAGAISGKQNTLVSGTNIKTVNNTSLLGSGNVAVQPTLVSGTNIKTVNNTSLLGSGNIDTSEVFVAEYGVTSFADIQTAYNAGKAVFCKQNNYTYLFRIDNSEAVFTSIGRVANGLVFRCSNSSVWTTETYYAEKTSNKVTSLSSSSTNTQYPSAKCVYDQLATKASISVSGTTLVIS